MSLSSKRCCGDSRTAGDAYLEIATSPNGREVEEFIWCPPAPVDMASLGASPVGVHLLPPRNIGGREVFYVIDWVGASHYPNVSDFIEEGKALGFSRKISGNFDYSKLSAESWIMFAHPRAIVQNATEYWAQEPADKKLLSCLPRTHQPQEECPMCSRVWRQDLSLPGISAEALAEFAGAGRRVERSLPCGWSYSGYLPPEGVTPEYVPGIFASFPLGKIAVVKSQDNSHQEKLARARKASLPVEEVDS
jgi:hypothetical protein